MPSTSSHVQRAPPREVDDARQLVIVRGNVRGGEGAAPRALGVAVLAPLVVRLAIGGGELLGVRFEVPLARLLERQGVDLRQAALGHLQQQVEAGSPLGPALLSPQELPRGGSVPATAAVR